VFDINQDSIQPQYFQYPPFGGFYYLEVIFWAGFVVYEFLTGE